MQSPIFAFVLDCLKFLIIPIFVMIFKIESRLSKLEAKIEIICSDRLRG